MSPKRSPPEQNALDTYVNSWSLKIPKGSHTSWKGRTLDAASWILASISSDRLSGDTPDSKLRDAATSPDSVVQSALSSECSRVCLLSVRNPGSSSMVGNVARDGMAETL